MKTCPILTSLAAFAMALPAQAHLVTDLEPGITASLTGGGGVSSSHPRYLTQFGDKLFGSQLSSGQRAYCRHASACR